MTCYVFGVIRSCLVVSSCSDVPQCADLSEVLEDVVQDDVLGLVGVHPGEGVHVDHRVLEAYQRDPQGALQGLVGGEGDDTHAGGESESSCYSCRVKFLCLVPQRT